MQDDVSRYPSGDLPVREIIAELLDTIDRLECERDDALDREAKAARYRHHLSYRLGAEIIARSRSLFGWLTLPIGLLSALRQFRRDMARGNSGPRRRARVANPAPLTPGILIPSRGRSFRRMALLANVTVRLSGHILLHNRIRGGTWLSMLVRFRDASGALLAVPADLPEEERTTLATRARMRKIRIANDARFDESFVADPDAAFVEIALLVLSKHARAAIHLTEVAQIDDEGRSLDVLRLPDLPKRSANAAATVGLDAMIWAGFSEAGLAELKAIVDRASEAPGPAAEAAWVLARWFMANDNPVEAEARLAIMGRYASDPESDSRYVLLRSALLCDAGQTGQARSLVRRALELRPAAPSLHLAMANTYLHEQAVSDPESERLDCINRVFLNRGLAPVGRRDAATALNLDTVTTFVGDAHCAVGEQLVTVIVPAYNAAATLPYALGGLVEQTWRNLDIIVIDDCSTDDTLAVAERIAATDPRIRVLRQDRNSGAYAVRNRGLAEARGALVTVNDADDWSHAQKIAEHVAAIGSESIGSISHWARVTHDLRFLGNFRPTAALVHWNHSSLLLDTDTARALGGWDPVRFASDSEFIDRVRRACGDRAITWIHRGVPLQFALNDIKSLTRAGPSHVRTVYHGVRRTYREAWRHWHATSGEPLFPLLDAPDARDPVVTAYPAPAVMLATPRAEPRLDLVIVADWNRPGNPRAAALAHADAAAAQGLAVGAIHWPYYLTAADPLDPAVLDRAAQGRLRVIAPGDAVAATAVMVADLAPLRWRMDMPPQVEADHQLVLVSQPPEAMPPFERARAHLEAWLGPDLRWIATNAAARDALAAEAGLGCADALWHAPLPGVAEAAAPRWRGDWRAQPILGRIALDTPDSWPEHPADLAAAHCAGQPCFVEILGGAGTAAKRLDRLPGNWRILPEGGVDRAAFLQRLDALLYFPGEAWQAQPDRACLEAMAAGVPVIAALACIDTLGTAAAYAEPEAVWPVAAHLCADEAAYRAQAAEGHAFVAGHCAQPAWLTRWQKAVGLPEPAATLEA